MRTKRRNMLASSILIACAACGARSPGGDARVAADGNGNGGAEATAADAQVGGSPGFAQGGADSASYLIEPAQTPVLGGAAGAGLKEGQCAERNVVTMRVVPTVWLVLDGSGSMVESLGDRSRWAALREALMDPNEGVVKALEREVSWGLVIYDGASPFVQPLPDGGTPMFSAEPATTCPRLVSVEPKQNNYTDIDNAYASSPLGGSTPTDQALRSVLSHLPDTPEQVLDGRVNPTIVVLATDGAPNNLCTVDFNNPDVQSNVVNVVAELANRQVQTYVISLAGDDSQLTQHLEQVAVAGMTGSPPFLPANKTELIQTFKEIIGPATVCDVVLNGSVKAGSECKGEIKINGVALPCNDPNGWKLKDASTITITGTACDDYRNNLTAILEADFPCEAIILN